MKKTKASKNLSNLCERLKQELKALDNLPTPEKEKAEEKRQALYKELKKQLKDLSD